MSECREGHWKCYDCERETHRRNLQRREVVVETPEPGSGYTETPVYLCSECIGRRFGYDCPQCGITHGDMEDARYCCRRAPGEAPDCRDCGDRMQREAWGYTADGRPTVEYASCERCGMGWGRFTGWHPPEEQEARDP